MNEQEKIYDRLMEASFDCKSINDVQVLVDVFKGHKWNGTNFRMLKWVLEKKLDYFKTKGTATSALKEGRKEFLNLHMN